MGLSEERLHTEEHALCHSPSIISLLYMEVEAEQYEEMSLFSICSAGEAVIPVRCHQS